jgi:hypothetical protein
MDGGFAIGVQYAIIAIAALVSAWVVLVKQFPRAARRLRTATAVVLLRDGRPQWLRAVGRAVAPVPLTGGSDCGGCNGCGPTPPR